MSNMYQKKWRDLIIEPFDIKYNNIKIDKIIGYPPAGNDVVECLGKVNNELNNIFIKIERSKVCDFTTEVKILNYLKKNNYYLKIPMVYEDGIFNDKKYIVLSKIEGRKLSDIFSQNKKNKREMLFKYGYELGLIHKVPVNKLNIAKQRVINDYPNENVYPNLFNETKIDKYIKFLKNNDIKKELKTFIHGDFHYGNVLWLHNCISGVIDWEYSGIGLKEQDIAWACILRPEQKFMDTIEDINCFLKGYLKEGNFDKVKLKWCLINGYCHFYLMNKDNHEYRNKILKLLEVLYEK